MHLRVSVKPLKWNVVQPVSSSVIMTAKFRVAEEDAMEFAERHFLTKSVF